MNTINVTKKFAGQSTTQFRMGNGQRYTFASKREAAAFLARTNRYLTKSLVILNETYCEIHTQYRRFWLTSANTNTGTRTNYFALCCKIKSNLDAAADVFEKFNAASSRSSDVFFAFIDLRKISLFLAEAAGELMNHHKKRNVTAHYYACMVLKERCEIIVEKLITFDHLSDHQVSGDD